MKIVVVAASALVVGIALGIVLMISASATFDSSSAICTLSSAARM